MQTHGKGICNYVLTAPRVLSLADVEGAQQPKHTALQTMHSPVKYIENTLKGAHKHHQL